MKWIISKACLGRTHCPSCLGDEEWRESHRIAGFEMPDTCPYGITKDTALSERVRALTALATTQEQLTALGKQLRQLSKSCCGKKDYDDDEI